jgi:hypothetical protein
LIRIPEEIDLLVAVKNRVRDLFEGLCQSQVSLRGGVGPPEAVHDPNLLFKSIEKIPARSASEVVQAVWIKIGLKQEESELPSDSQNIASINKIFDPRSGVYLCNID